MKKSNIKKFEEFNEKLNVSDIKNHLNENYEIENYDCISKEDLSEIIVFFLEDLEQYNKENNITMNNLEIQKSIDIFKNDYLEKGTYYSEKEKYEEIVIDDDGQSDDYFDNLISVVLKK